MAIANTQSLKTSLNVDPYYDDFDESKNFYRLLYRPGLAVQARELTQMQSMLQNQIDRFAEHVFKEGTVVRGVDLNYDEDVPFVRIRDNQSNGATANLTLLNSTELTGGTSGVKAVVVGTKFGSEANTPGTKTLYVQYTGSGTNKTSKTFTLGEKLTANNGQTANVISSAAFGIGSRVTLGEGIIYAKDHFIKTPESSIIVGEYNSNTANFKVGFNLTESITTSNTDTTLLDPAQGAYNFTAPGANRLTITPTITKFALTDTATTDFVEILRIKNGFLTMLGNEPKYNILGDAMANRTFEESGDYIVTGNKIRVREHLKSGNNNGVFASGSGGNNDLLSVDIGPGLAYVRGFRIDNREVQHVEVRKGTDTVTKEDELVSANYGNYVNVREVSGAWDLNGHDRVELYNSKQFSVSNNGLANTTFNGSVLGRARVRGIEYSSGQKGSKDALYKLYLYDIKMTANTFNNVRSIGHASSVGASGKADTVLVNSNTVLNDTSFSRSIFELPSRYIKTVKDGTGTNDTDYTFYKAVDVTIANNGQFTVATGAADETYPTGTGTLSSTQKDSNFYLTLSGNANTAALSGTIGFSAGGNTITGTSSKFTTEVNVGDKLKVNASQYANSFTVTQIVSATSLKTLENANLTKSSQNYFKDLPSGSVINMSGVGGDEATRSVVVGSSTSATFDIQEPLINSVSARLHFKLRKANGVEKQKTYKFRRLVQIRCANNVNTTNGPYDLGFADVHKIRFIRKHSSAFSAATDGKDVTEEFLFDNGQRDSLYEHAKISKIPTSTLSLSSSDHLLVCFDFFEHDTSSGTGYFSVDSYPVDDANLLSNTAIQTQDIPVYESKVTGREYDLRGSLDARPKIENSATDTAVMGSMTTNPSVRTNVVESTGGLHFPAAATNYDLDCQIYLGRRDFIVLDRYGSGRSIEGLALEKPLDPTTARTDTMLMAKLDIRPFPSLPSRIAREAGRSDLANKLEIVGNRRYTMRDIGVLENRVRVLEYYTAISLLEGRAKDFDKKDSTGLTRFKNGFFVDNFTGHGKSDIFDNDYEAAIDRGLRELRPGKTTVNLEIDFAQANSTNVTARSKEIVVELAADVAFQEGETVTIGGQTGKIKYIVGLQDRTGTHATETFGNAKKLYIEEYTGTAALIHGATITGSSSGVSTTIVIDSASGADDEPIGDAHFNKRLMNRLGIPFNTGKPGLGLRPIGRLITFPYTSEVLIEQPFATGSRNALGLSFKYVGNLALDPSVSMWNDRTKGPDISINYDGNLEAWAALTGEILPRIAGRCWNKLWGDWTADGGGGGGRWVRRDGEELTFIPGNEIKSDFEVVTDVTIQPFIKAQTIHGQAYGLKPDTQHFPFFDGVDVSAFCQQVTKLAVGSGETAEYSNTSNLGSPLFTDANGAVTFAFNLPSDETNQFTSGDRIPFVLTDSSSNSRELGIVTSSATAEFAGGGLDVSISKGQFAVTPITVERTAISERRFIPTPRRDPLAQSFEVKRETFSGEIKDQDLESVGAFLTKADLYFQSKDATLPITVDIRAMDEESGQPTQIIIPNSKVVLQPYEINVSPNGLVPTCIYFDTPVFLLSGKQYCIVIKPDPRNTNCRVFTARLGENDILTENRVTSQPHSGILFTSSNEFTWRQQQEEDLKMKLYFAKFDTSQTGEAVLKNRGYEFLKVSNTSGQYTDFGERINGETVVTLTSTSLSNSASLAGKFVQGATSGAVGKFASQNTAANTINISDVGATQFSNGEFIRFRTGNSNTGTIVGNTAVSIGMATANGVLYYYDDFSRANNNILYLDKGSGNFKAGMKVKGQRSGLTAQIDKITDSPIDAIYLHNSQMALPGCSISAKGKFGATATTRDTTFTKLNSQMVTEGLTNRRLCLSSSNETTNLSGAKSLEVVYTMTNSVDPRLSPAIDMRLGNILLIENFINNDTTNEEATAGGNALARHITKTVELADGQDAEDLVVVLDAFKPQGTDVHVYYKILHADDGDTMRDVPYVKMIQDTEANLYSSSENTEDFKEYEFSIPTSKQTGHNDTVEYLNTQGVTFAGFKNFKIKIVFTGSNTTLPPRVRDLRVIALQR